MKLHMRLPTRLLASLAVLAILLVRVHTPGQEQSAGAKPADDKGEDTAAVSGSLAQVDLTKQKLRAEIERLRALSGTSEANPGRLRKVRRELAKLGVQEERKRIFEDLQSEDRGVQYDALVDTATLADREAIWQLGEMLDSPRRGGRYVTVGPNGERSVSSEAFLAPSMVAAMKLATLVENPVVPPIGPEKKFYTEEDVRIWREWWDRNKAAYEP